MELKLWLFFMEIENCKFLEIIIKLVVLKFGKFELKYGELLVRCVLGYIIVFCEGIVFIEMEDIFLLDEVVMDDVMVNYRLLKWCCLSVLWIRLFEDLFDFFMLILMYGVIIYVWVYF